MIEALPLATALVLGFAHALEPDHLVAVTAFVSRRPGPRSAVGFGVRWGTGHATAIVMAGALVAVAGIHVTGGEEATLELGVGLTLVGLGAWVIRGARALHVHEHAHADGTTHTHLHSHRHGAHHRHGHTLSFIGALHGLAGTGAAVSLLPLALLDSPLAAGAYLAVFGIGTIAGMVLYTLIAGLVYGRLARRSEPLARALARLTGLASIAVGVWWIARRAAVA